MSKEKLEKSGRISELRDARQSDATSIEVDQKELIDRRKFLSRRGGCPGNDDAGVLLMAGIFSE